MLVLKKCKTFKLSSTNICGILLTLCTSWDRGTNKVSWVMRWIHFRHEASLLSHIARENKNSLSLSHPYTCTHIHSHILTHIHTHTHKQTRQKRRDTQKLAIFTYKETRTGVWKLGTTKFDSILKVLESSISSRWISWTSIGFKDFKLKKLKLRKLNNVCYHIVLPSPFFWKISTLKS